LALQRTAFRRNLVAVGGDERVAYTAGINVARVRASAYVLSGGLAAVAGITLTAMLGSAHPTVGPPYTLTSIAGTALGGISLAGGRGGLLGAAAGGAILFLVENLLTLARVSVFHLQIAYGAILIVALAINSLGERYHRSRLAALAA
jgi:ribose transport system permease protein